MPSRRAVLLRPTRPVLLDDRFTGAAIDTGGWTAIDTEAKIGVAGGLLSFSGGRTAVPIHGDPGVVSVRSFPRRAGLTLECRSRSTTTTVNAAYLAWANNPTAETPATDHEYRISQNVAAGISAARQGTTVATPAAYAANVFKHMRLVLKATGCLFYASDDGAAWKLVWDDATGAATPLYAAHYNFAAVVDTDHVRVYQGRVKPPAAEDTFTRADSATALGTAETGQAWGAPFVSNGSGTPVMGITGNKAYVVSTPTGSAFFQPLSGEVGSSDFLLECDLTWTTGDNLGLLFCWNGDSTVAGVRGYMARITGTQLGLFDVAGNNTFNALGSAYSFTALSGTTYRLRVVKIGTSIKVYLDDGGALAERITATDALYQANQRVGLRVGDTTTTSARFDNFRVQTGIG